ncbi:hypothetical protein ACQKKX_02335 [Neorhizobium sp. NPDC001467]|uniref:hypothetical protein n=1 Tax=Neorhizobium sp. NPDC001467 TaxID=3390595 RepID=UPI003CFE82C4
MAFYCTHALLEVGSSVKPGNYGRVLRANGYAHAAALRESILEDVRSRSFSHLPSRLDAAFYFDHIENARAYNQTERLNFVNWYEVSRLNVHAMEARADFRRVVPMGMIGLDWAEAYWRGIPLPFADQAKGAECFTETFSVTKLRIERRVDDEDLNK